MKHFKLFVLAVFIWGGIVHADRCQVPSSIRSMTKSVSIEQLKSQSSDIRRNYRGLKNMCLNIVTIKEGSYNWRMLLVTHPKHSRGAFWFLPHDNENTAFSSAVYAVQRYGGGFLAVMANNSRYFKGQDPNRNFGDTAKTAQRCSKQKSPAPKYSKTIFKIINTFRGGGYPYLALHNNTNGGGVSMLKSSKKVQSYPANGKITRGSGGLSDEDSLVYTAGVSKKPNKNKLNHLLKAGLNTKYEVIDRSNNDCSMSNYVVLKKRTEAYYNIETQHGDFKTQKTMIDRLMRIIK